MRIKIFHWLCRLLILAFIAGTLPIANSSGTIFAQEQKKKKKPASATGKPSPAGQPAKKTASGTKPGQKQTATKKAPPKKASTKKAPSTKKPQPTKKPAKGAVKKVAAKPVPKKEVSLSKISDELFEYSNKMNSSLSRMAYATRFLTADESKKEVVRLESKEKFSTADFEAAADKEPNNILVQRQLGMHYEQRQDWENAKDVYLRIVAKNPHHPDAHYFLGNMYQNLGDMGKARQAYEEALALDPNHRATLDMLAAGKNSRENTDVLERSALHDPEGPAQKLTIIKQKLNASDYDEAIKLAVSSQDQYPENSGFVYLQGKAHESLGNMDKAKTAYQNAIKMDPRNEEAHLSLGHLYFNQGKYVYAALAFSDVVYLNNYHVDARYMQGLSYFNANEWGRAASSWEDLLHYAPEHPLVKTLLPQTYYVLAVEYNRQGESTLGRTSFSKALSVNNHTQSWLPGAMRTLGKYYREKGMFNESLAAYQEVVELKPMDSDAYTGMGITYWKMNEQQLAKAAWQRSLELNPDNNEAKGWLMIARQG